MERIIASTPRHFPKWPSHHGEDIGKGAEMVSVISRRQLLRLTGLAGLGAVGTPLGRFDVTTSVVEAAARSYLNARSRAMDSNLTADMTAVQSLVAASNPALRDFLGRDLSTLHRAIHSQGPLISIQHDARIDYIVGNVVYAYERVAFPWKNEGSIAFPVDLPPEAKPSRKPVIESAVGYYHRIEFEPAGSALRVRRDAFRGVAWDSPDFLRTAAVIGPSQSPTATRRGLMKLARPVASSYLWDYAVNYCYTYWSSYNPSYYNYNASGGDCTSFISQALANAGWIAGDRNDPNAYWYDAAVAPWVGVAWYNNNQQKPWVLNNGRGWDAGGTPQDLYRGDIVYYDWNASDGVLDHTVMVTTIPASTGRRLVSGHNPDCNEVDWETFWASWLSPFATYNIRLNATY